MLQFNKWLTYDPWIKAETDFTGSVVDVLFSDAFILAGFSVATHDIKLTLGPANVLKHLLNCIISVTEFQMTQINQLTKQSNQLSRQPVTQSIN